MRALGIGALLILISCHDKALALESEVVYDSLSSTVFGGGYILPSVSNQLGEDLQLGYHSASISKIEILLKSFSTANTVDIKIHLYAFDDPTNSKRPGTTLWSSNAIHMVVPQTPEHYSFDVPNVVLPRRFGWTIETVAYPGSFTGVGLPGVPSPTIGNALAVINYWPQQNPSMPWFWQKQQNPQSFGLRLTGLVIVPEPHTAVTGFTAIALTFSVLGRYAGASRWHAGLGNQPSLHFI